MILSARGEVDCCLSLADGTTWPGGGWGWELAIGSWDLD